MKRRKRISEMTHKERLMFLLDNVDRKVGVELGRRVLRQAIREYCDIENILKKAEKAHGKSTHEQ